MKEVELNEMRNEMIDCGYDKELIESLTDKQLIGLYEMESEDRTIRI